jgi:hypothetical protein
MKNSSNLFLGFNLIKRFLNLKNSYIKTIHFRKDYANDFFNKYFLIIKKFI